MDYLATEADGRGLGLSKAGLTQVVLLLFRLRRTTKTSVNQLRRVAFSAPSVLHLFSLSF